MNEESNIMNPLQKLISDKKLIFTGLIILVVVLFALDIFFGSVSIRPSDVIHAIFSSTDKSLETIIFRFRIPKALTALIVGIALSLSGLQMQTVFRNPMAGPYVLGISSGASLGVAFVILGFSAQMSQGVFRVLEIGLLLWHHGWELESS